MRVWPGVPEARKNWVDRMCVLTYLQTPFFPQNNELRHFPACIRRICRQVPGPLRLSRQRSHMRSRNPYRTNRRSRFGRRCRLAKFVPIFLPLAALIWLGASRTPEIKTLQNPALVPETPPVAASIAAVPEPRFSGIVGRIRHRETFWDALNREDVAPSRIHELLNALKKGIPRKEFDPGIVRTGDRYALSIDSLGAIQAFEFIKKGAVETRYVAARKNGGLSAHIESMPLERRVAIVTGEIRTTLWNALSETGEEADVLTGKMSGIFEYEIDFMVDCRAGEPFCPGTGEVLQGRPIPSVWGHPVVRIPDGAKEPPGVSV